MNKKELLMISIAVFLTVIAWLVSDIFHASTQETIKTKISTPDMKKYDIKDNIFLLLKEKKP